MSDLVQLGPTLTYQVHTIPSKDTLKHALKICYEVNEKLWKERSHANQRPEHDMWDVIQVLETMLGGH